MRQTRRTAPAVVALLLALGADARVGLVYPQVPNNAPFPDAVTDSTKWGQSGGNWKKLLDGLKGSGSNKWDDYKDFANAEEGSCVSCIRTGAVWCSQIFIAERKDSAYGITTKLEQGDGSSTKNIHTATSLKTTVGDAATHDLGQCCYDKGAVTAGTTAGEALIANKYTCAAAYSGISGTGGRKATDYLDGDATKVEYIKSTATKWWCSDGRIAADSTTTPGQVVTAHTISAATASVNPNDTAGNADPRTEFWLASCRQRQDTCGGAALITTPAIDAFETREIKVATMTFQEKCTWILKTDGKGAPTFKIEKVTNIIDAKYDLHYMEYSIKGTDTIDVGNQPGQETSTGQQQLPLISSNDGFKALKGRLYDRTAYPETESPLVWMWANQAEAVDSAKAGYLKKRWFPPSIAEQEVADYATLKGAYEGLRTAYGTAKDAYEKAMTPPEADFFGDLFSPPEKKTPPTRPDLPTQIGDYKGLRVAPYKNTKEYKYTNDASNAKDKLKDVAANEFVADGEYGGGWGAFTMGLLPIEDGMGKSFGVFGYSKAAKMDASYVQMASHMCKTPDATTGHCAKVDGTDASLAFQILVVSVWTGDAMAAACSSTKGIKISFTQSKWALKKDTWGAPGTPTAAVAAKTTFGAQALAASTAAAVAVASALY